jgi:hypothetical protein
VPPIIKINKIKYANDIKKDFPEEAIGMANKHMKKYSSTLAIAEMQMKTMMKYYCTAIKRDKIKNGHNSKYWRGSNEVCF